SCGTVGQFENSLMPWRTDGSDSTSMPLNLTPIWLRICTTAAEKPHCGNPGVPFMKSTTGVSAISWRMRSGTVMSIGLSSVEKRPQRGLRPGVVCRRLLVRYACLQGERVQLVAHSVAQRLINHLMLLHPALAAKRAGDDMRGIMVAIAAQILDRDLRVGQAVLDQPLDRRRVHRHPSIPAFRLTALTLRHVTRQPSLVCGLEVRDRYGTGPRKCQFGVGTPALDCADPPRRHPGALGLGEQRAGIGGLDQVTALVFAEQPCVESRARGGGVERYAQAAGHRHLGDGDDEAALGKVMAGRNRVGANLPRPHI